MFAVSSTLRDHNTDLMSSVCFHILFFSGAEASVDILVICLCMLRHYSPCVFLLHLQYSDIHQLFHLSQKTFFPFAFPFECYCSLYDLKTSHISDDFFSVEDHKRRKSFVL